MSEPRRVLARRVYRTGVQTVEAEIAVCEVCNGKGRVEEYPPQPGRRNGRPCLACDGHGATGVRFLLTIRNRSYASEHEVSRETALRYVLKLNE